MTIFRRVETGDLTEIAAIQTASPEAAQWDVAGYSGYDLLVAVTDGRVSGFLAARSLGEGERELLNLAVLPAFRRQGIASGLMRAFLTDQNGAVFLEVRESNIAARKFYKSLGFQEVNKRSKYYSSPMESGIVMHYHS
jgi:ribosomal-protein-alanine N-acetyltransferase